MIAMLPRPVGRQKEVLALPASGHTVVLGTAGSGKTTLAIHRAAYLANTATDHGGRTLLVTFNKCLVAYLQSLSGGGLRNVEVRNYHHFARGYLATRGKMAWNAIADANTTESYVQDAINAVKETGEDDPLLDRPVEFIAEEFRWLSQNWIRTVDDYLEAENAGRMGSRVPLKSRPIIFTVYQHYRELRNAGGKPYDWDDLAQTVVSEFAEDDDDRYYRHVVIDEGQDFSPVMLHSLAAAIPSDGSLTFFGDMAQQIYGHKVSWRSAGLNVRDKDIWKFEQNYRNTKQIAQLALAIAQSRHYRGVADLVAPKSPVADGPLPALVDFDSEQAELRFVKDQAQKLAKTGTVAVLFRDRDLEKRLQIRATRLHRELASWPTGPRVFYGTYHAAKGLEFDSVLIPFTSATRLPHPPDVEAFGDGDAAARNAKLLYVAVTRAKSNLVLTHTGEPTPLLPNVNGLLQRSKR
ncbi:3'-5' exonuclease [Sorangium sp. So ce1024]|uniref:3'-5' exonuclease n=1 Tax=Sorangium sp. So ce1024 TaxID=3133327 RepID=UPI003F013FBA